MSLGSNLPFLTKLSGAAPPTQELIRSAKSWSGLIHELVLKICCRVSADQEWLHGPAGHQLTGNLWVADCRTSLHDQPYSLNRFFALPKLTRERCSVLSQFRFSYAFYIMGNGPIDVTRLMFLTIYADCETHSIMTSWSSHGNTESFNRLWGRGSGLACKWHVFAALDVLLLTIRRALCCCFLAIVPLELFGSRSYWIKHRSWPRNLGSF